MFKLKKWKKNFTVFLLTFIMLSNMVLGEWSGVLTIHAEESKNLLKNGDFENGGLDEIITLVDKDSNIILGTSGWKATNYWNTTKGDVSYSIIDGVGYDGSKALKVSKADTDTEKVYRTVPYQTAALEANKTYYFEVKVKAVGVENTADTNAPYISLSYQNKSKNNVGFEPAAKVEATAATDWYTLKGEITPAESFNALFRINVYQMTGGYWLIDEVSVTKKPEEPTAAITLNGTEVKSVEVEIGKETQLVTQMTDPDNVLGGKAVAFNWSSADETIATVDANGLVKAVGIGKTSITATSADGKYVVICEFTVTEVFVELESITMAKSELNLCAGGQEKLEVTILPENATEQTLSWTSSDESVAKVGADGIVTGLGAGTATITATTKYGKNATCTVNVMVNTVLTAQPVALETDFGTPITGDLSGNLTNNTGSTAAYKLYTAPENGKMTVNADGTYSYIPHTTSDTTTDSFVVLVTAGEYSAVISASITIGSLSDCIIENLVSGSNLLFSKEELEAVKMAIATEGTLQNEIWAEYQPYLESMLGTTPTAYTKDETDEWQRGVADGTVGRLIAYLITEDDAYKEACLKYAEAIANYDYWGGSSYWQQAQLAAGHNSFALALVYNWLKDEMSTELRDTILKRLYYACQCFEVHWDGRKLYMHNHSWICMTGLVAATTAIYLDADYAYKVVKGDSDIDVATNSVGNNLRDYDVDVTKETLLTNCERWLTMAVDKIGTSYEWMPQDGTNQEGAGYAEYGTEWLLKASLLLEHNLGIDTFTGNGYFENHSEYFLNVIYPANSLSPAGCLIDYADGTRSNWYGPVGHMRVLAAKYQDATAQWIAETMEDAGATSKSSFWMGLIWGDGNVEAKLDPEKSTLYYSEDMGIAVARSDWSGDEGMLFMRSGLPLGKAANALLNTDTNEYHVDVDCNAIILYYNGEYLLKSDGYAWKDSGNDSTLLINGVGQIGEGALGMVGDSFIEYGYEPTMIIVDDADTYSYFVGDATEAYAPGNNLNKFQRNVVFLKEENVVLVVDDIKTTQNSELELRWFSESKNVIESYGIYSAYGTNNTMNFYPFNTMKALDNSVTTAFTEADVYNRSGKQSSEMALIQNYTGTDWQNAVAFSWAPNGEVASQIKYEAGNANEHKFEVNGKVYTLNVSTNTLTVETGSLNQENEWDADSTLANILFNQDALEGFDSTKLTQEVERFWKTEEVNIMALPSSPTAQAVVDWDGKCPGTVTITCTSGDKSSETVYTLNMKNDNGLLSIASAASTPNTKGISETCSYDNYIQESGDDRTWASTKLPVIIYDMGSLVDISKIDVAFNKSRNRETYYNLLISEDGENWTTVLDDKTAPKTASDLRLSEYQTIYDGDELRAQYVKFELRGHTNETKKDQPNEFNSIQEVSFYGVVVVSDTDSDTDSDTSDSSDAENEEPEIITEGTVKSYTKGSNAKVSIHCTGELDDLVGVKMDGKEVDESNYSKEKGSTIVTFKADYLETLSVGEHTVTLVYTGNREVNSTLNLFAATSDNTDDNTGDNTDDNDDDNTGDDADTSVAPEVTNTQSAPTPTGDSSNPGLWIMFMLVSSVGIVAAMFVIKRRKN